MPAWLRFVQTKALMGGSAGIRFRQNILHRSPLFVALCTTPLPYLRRDKEPTLDDGYIILISAPPIE